MKNYKINMLTSYKRSFIDVLELRNFILELATTTKLLDPGQAAAIISILDSVDTTYKEAYEASEESTEVEFGGKKLSKLILKTLKSNSKNIPQEILLSDVEDIKEEEQMPIIKPLNEEKEEEKETSSEEVAAEQKPRQNNQPKKKTTASKPKK